MANWYNEIGPESDIIVTSRIRLARNITGFPFPSKMSEQQRAEMTQKVKKALLEINAPFAKNLRYIDMGDVPEREVYAMVERHIISPEFAGSNSTRGIIISEDESVSVMIGEEDHLRIQVLKTGLNLKEAYDIAERLDTLLCQKLGFAYNSELGFLTECPTNIGTGLRASVMMHLPMLDYSSAVRELTESVNKIGFTMRGLYGEGSNAGANLYQLSNQITLGITEQDALDNLEAIAKQFIAKELEAREKTDKQLLEDEIFRAFGILKNARLLSSKEMLRHLSLIKLGVSMGIINIDASLPIKLLVEGQPNMLMRAFGELDSRERDIKRASFIREAL
ncbi:MAG: protein arginine kinase [Clostridia bacterium]|nr:protein arginine kinase [Clostridia bacterium]